MNSEQKQQALAAWYQLLNEPLIGMECEDQYDDLLKAADEMERLEIINSTEWRQLVREAGMTFATAPEGIEGGT